MKERIPDTTARTGQNWCSIGKPAVAFIQHTKNALNVFLRCSEGDGAHLSVLVDPASSLSLSERKNLGSEWAKTTPYFLRITTTEEAKAAVPLLLFLAQRPSSRQRSGVMAMPSEDAADHWEGNRALIYVNRYERDPKVRALCIKTYGTSCTVCEFDFGRIYGEIGTGFIHVHHLRPLSEVATAHKVDPKKDLRPVCPNCHEMLHRRTPPFSIEELRAIRNRLH
jgi:predicted HNH restriction endonuclease